MRGPPLRNSSLRVSARRPRDRARPCVAAVRSTTSPLSGGGAGGGRRARAAPSARRRVRALAAGRSAPAGRATAADTALLARGMARACAEGMTTPTQRRGAKSLADDPGLGRGVVLSRAAASLRSIETKPFDWEICPLRTGESPPTPAAPPIVSLRQRRTTDSLSLSLSLCLSSDGTSWMMDGRMDFVHPAERESCTTGAGRRLHSCVRDTVPPRSRPRPPAARRTRNTGGGPGRRACVCAGCGTLSVSLANRTEGGAAGQGIAASPARKCAFPRRALGPDSDSDSESATAGCLPGPRQKSAPSSSDSNSESDSTRAIPPVHSRGGGPVLLRPLPGRPGRSKCLSGEKGPVLHSCNSTRAPTRRRSGAPPPAAGPPRPDNGSVGAKGTTAPLVQFHSYATPAAPGPAPSRPPAARCSSARWRAARPVFRLCRGKRDLCSTRAIPLVRLPGGPGPGPVSSPGGTVLLRPLASGSARVPTLSGQKGPVLHSCNSTRTLPRRRCGAPPSVSGAPPLVHGDCRGKRATGPSSAVKCSSARRSPATVVGVGKMKGLNASLTPPLLYIGEGCLA